MEKGLEPLEVLPPTSQQKQLSYSFWVWYKFLLLEYFNLIIQSTKEDWKLPWDWTCKTFKWSKTKVSHWSCSAMENPCKEPPSILQPKSVLKDVELSSCNHVLQVWPFREYRFFYCYVCKWSPGDRVCYRMTQWVLIYPKRSEKLDLRQKALWYSLAVIVSKICYLF